MFKTKDQTISSVFNKNINTSQGAISDVVPKSQMPNILSFPTASPNLYEILQTDCLSDKLPFEHCELCPSQCSYRGHLGRVLMNNLFNFDVFVDFAESNSQEALAYCIQTAEHYFQRNKTVEELNKLRSEHFGFCLFGAATYGFAQRKGMNDKTAGDYLLNRAREALAILRSHIYI